MTSVLFQDELSFTNDTLLSLPLSFTTSSSFQDNAFFGTLTLLDQVRPGRRSQNIWSPAEDACLTKIMSGPQQRWKDVTEQFNEAGLGRHRDTSSIVQHWVRVLNPKKITRKWSIEEDQMLVNQLKLAPPRQWKKIADQMPDRTDNQIVSRLKAIKRHVMSRENLSEDLFP